jgi:hypothetical protein
VSASESLKNLNAGWTGEGAYGEGRIRIRDRDKERKKDIGMVFSCLRIFFLVVVE